MTSGQFEAVSPDFIWVNRETRQRRDLKDIAALAKSIAENGLIHPPVIKRDGELVVGERRWTAVKALGWTSVAIQWVDELSEIELHALEYEENLSRSDITWQEQALAIERYHQLRVAQDPTWNAERTAERLGVSNTKVGEHRSVAKALIAGDTRVSAAPKFSTAKSIVTRNDARKKASAAENLEAEITGVAVAAKTAPIILGDFHEFAASYTGNTYNLIHCDFPYGVGMHTTDQGGARYEHGSYNDSPDIYWALLDTLGLSMSNVVSESAHLMFWFSMDFYAETKLRLEKMGWRVNPFPLIWLKSDNIGVIPDANRGPRRIYETAFLASRGDRLIHTPVSNAFAHPGRDKSIHMNEKPVVMLKHFLRMLTDGYSRVLDPTCGSGNALKAATALGASTVIGIERDPEFFERATGAYFDDDEPNLGL